MIAFERVKDFRVLLVGDGIIDEYIYVKPLGKSIKDIAISARFERKESFRGGVWAAAAHVQNFCSHVNVISGLRVMTNSRFIEETYMRKMFTVHEMKDNNEMRNASFDPDIWGEGPYKTFDIPSYDLVIVTDFGHGALTKSLIEQLSKEARFLAVNTQTNTTNFGFNLITRYPKADLVVLDELEARLAVHDRDSDIEDVILKLGYKNIIVTMGYNGAVGFDGAFHRVKGTVKDVVDTMGAGDAFLAVCAPFAAARFSMRDVVRVGNAAGVAKIGIVGHRASVTPDMLREHLGS